MTKLLLVLKDIMYSKCDDKYQTLQWICGELEEFMHRTLAIPEKIPVNKENYIFIYMVLKYYQCYLPDDIYPTSIFSQEDFDNLLDLCMMVKKEDQE